MSIWYHLERFGWLFYIVSPNKTSFENVEDVPDYLTKAAPYIITLFIVETFILRLQRKPIPRINHSISSISMAEFSETSRVYLNAWKIGLYVYAYSNWRLITLPWNSIWVWCLAFFFCDFLFYWGHRALHEIRFLWAHHRIHHSSEDFNMITSLRLGFFQNFIFGIVYLPMAFLIPPGVYLAHSNFNLLYQIWIHTEAVKSLGPLEYILNTPSHHRVHHGVNRSYIDKNYGGTLIIWDRMFGTFEPEKEPIAYGLTVPVNTFDPFYIQFFYFKVMWNTFWDMKGWKNKFQCLIKGPGWSPGKPWRGNVEDIPEVTFPIEKYDPPIPNWLKWYMFLHMGLELILFIEILDPVEGIPRAVLFSSIAYQTLSVSCAGMLVEERVHAPWLELIRCVAYFALDIFVLPYTSLSSYSPVVQVVFLTVLRVIFIISSAFWMRKCIKNVSITFHKKTTKID